MLISYVSYHALFAGKLCPDIINHQILMSIRVRPINANLTHDTELIDKMDPYCKIYFGGQQFRSQVCEFGGKNPSWNDSFTFNPTGDSNLRVEVWDHDSVNDDLVGEGSFNLMSVYNMPAMRCDNQYIDLFYKGRPAGRILISFELQNMAGYWGGQQGVMGNQMGGNWANNSGWNGGMGQQPPMTGGGWGGQQQGWGVQQPGWGQQPPMMQPPMMNGGYGMQPPMGGGFNNMPPPNNGWGPNPNNGWGGGW